MCLIMLPHRNPNLITNQASLGFHVRILRRGEVLTSRACVYFLTLTIPRHTLVCYDTGHKP